MEGAESEIASIPSKETITTALKEIFQVSTDVALIGGVGGDILISGEVAKPHKDIDMVADAKRASDILESLGRIGYEGAVENTNVEKIKMRKGEIEVGIGLLQPDSTGGVYIQYKGANVHFDKSVLGDIKTVNGFDVKVASPLGMIQTLNLPAALGRLPSGKHTLAREAIGNKYFPGEKTDSGKYMPQVVGKSGE